MDMLCSVGNAVNVEERRIEKRTKGFAGFSRGESLNAEKNLARRSMVAEFIFPSDDCIIQCGVGLTCEANLGINRNFRSIKPSALLPVTRLISESLPLTLGLNTRKHSVDSLEIDWLHQISIKPRIDIFLYVSFDQ